MLRHGTKVKIVSCACQICKVWISPHDNKVGIINVHGVDKSIYNRERVQPQGNYVDLADLNGRVATRYFLFTEMQTLSIRLK